MLSQGVWLGFYDWCALWNDSGLYDMVLYRNWVGSVFCDTALYILIGGVSNCRCQSAIIHTSDWQDIGWFS